MRPAMRYQRSLRKRPSRTCLPQVAVGAADDAHVGLTPLVVAEALVALVVEEGEQLALHVERELGHLVEEERSPARALDGALDVGVAARVRALLRAEEAGAREVLVDLGAVDGFEGPAVPVSVGVVAAREGALARARLAEEHRLQRPRRRLGDASVRLSKRGRREDEIVAVFEAPLLAQPRGLRVRVLDHLLEHRRPRGAHRARARREGERPLGREGHLELVATRASASLRAHLDARVRALEPRRHLVRDRVRKGARVAPLGVARA